MTQPFLFAFCAFLMLMVLLSWVGYRLIYKPGRFLRQLGLPVIALDARRIMVDGNEPQVSTLVTVLNKIGSPAVPSAEGVANLRPTQSRRVPL
jgi:peptidoglycan/LPS O-acetylase OafA/YrhL